MDIINENEKIDEEKIKIIRKKYTVEKFKI